LFGRFLAAVKACGPRALLSHFSAATLYRYVEWDGRLIDVTVVGASRRRRPRLRVHRTAELDPRDHRIRDGIPLTSPARTILDLASMLPYAQLRRAVRQAQSVEKVTFRQLLDVIGRHPGRRGIRKLRAILATGPAPTRSELEDVVLDLILGGGFEHPEVNVPLELEARRVLPDFRWPERRLIVEADGQTWHDNKLAREDDAERQALLERHGEHVIRVTWDQAIRHPAETLARIRAAGAPRGT
jgi:hypothetical protein